MKKILKFRENEKEEAIQMMKNMIDSYSEKKDTVNVLKWQDRLKTKYNIEYEPMSQYESIIPSLDTLYTSSDFPSLKEYNQYCFSMFDLRWKKFGNKITNKFSSKKVNFEDMKKILESKGYELLRDFNKSSSHIAFVTGKKMSINFSHEDINKDDTILLDIFVHEMAHVFENAFSFDMKSRFSHNMALASSNYLLNPSEVFAEHFKHYFLEPKYLKSGWEDVYAELDKVIPKDWKVLIQSIISVAR